MSVLITGYVFDRYPVGGNELLIALALADHASDDGTRIFPSVARLAKKTRLSERTVQRILGKMCDSGWLVLVKNEDGGRGNTREYRINSDWIKGDNLSPFNVEKGDTAVSQKGDTAVSPEPSLTINNKSYVKNGSKSVSDGPPFFEIFRLWNEIVVPQGVPSVSRLIERRRLLIKDRWLEDEKHRSLDFWRDLFEYVAESDFLMGRLSKDGKPFCSFGFDWVLKLENFVKIVEGNYDNRR